MSLEERSQIIDQIINDKPRNKTRQIAERCCHKLSFLVEPQLHYEHTLYDNYDVFKGFFNLSYDIITESIST